MLPTLYKNPEKGVGMIFAGPSGYGKTTLAIACAKYLADGKLFNSYLGSDPHIVLNRHVNIIDEVHLMKTPEELYPVLDEGNKVIILTTNFSGNLPEALQNRCRQYIFTEYDKEELLLMAMDSTTFKASEENYLKLVDATGGNPRELKILVDDFGQYFQENPQISSLAVDFNQILENVFQIKNGLNTLSRRYLEVLSDVGGKSSLHLLQTILHLDSNVITQQIEPVLLKKGLIQITSKGRMLV